MVVRAEVHTDDWRNSALFDATPWFEQASENEIMDLYRCGWAADYEADAVAEFVSDLPGYERVDAVFGNGPFSVSVDPDTAKVWLMENKPEVFMLILMDEDAEMDVDAETAAIRERAEQIWSEEEENYQGYDYATLRSELVP